MMEITKLSFNVNSDEFETRNRNRIVTIAQVHRSDVDESRDKEYSTYITDHAVQNEYYYKTAISHEVNDVIIDESIKTAKRPRKATISKKVSIVKSSSNKTLATLDRKSTINKQENRSGKDRKRLKLDYSIFESTFESLGDGFIERLAKKRKLLSSSRSSSRGYSFETELKMSGERNNDTFSRILAAHKRDNYIKAEMEAIKNCDESTGFCIYNCNDIITKVNDYQIRNHNREIESARSFLNNISDKLIVSRSNLEISNKTSIEFKTCTEIYKSLHTYYHSEIFNTKNV